MYKVHEQQHADGVDDQNITQGEDIKQEWEKLRCANDKELKRTKSNVKNHHWDRGETEGVMYRRNICHVSATAYQL